MKLTRTAILALAGAALILAGVGVTFVVRGVPAVASLTAIGIGAVLLFIGLGFRRSLLLLAGGFVFFVFGWVPYYLGGIATLRRFRYNDTENAGLTPASFHEDFEDVSFKARDGVVLKGWWVPCPEAKGSVILVHGLNRTRLEMVRKLPFLQEAGWNALAFDLRHHGDSGGTATTFGYLERQDVEGALEFVKARSSRPVVLWGVSLGAATSVLVASDDRSVAGVVCDSSYRSLKDTVGHHLELFRHFAWWLRPVPRWPVAEEVLFWIGQRGHFPTDAVDVLSAASKLDGRPCLFVANSGDKRMPKEIAFELKEAAGPKAAVLLVPGDSHGGAFRDGTEAYKRAVAHLLDEAIAAPAAAAASLKEAAPNAGSLGREP